jgi:transcription elongation factor GreA
MEPVLYGLAIFLKWLNNMKQMHITQHGYQELQEERKVLLQKRPLVVKDLQKARDMGDLSENGFYKATKSQLAQLDRRLRELQYFISRSTIIQKVSGEEIRLGSSVRILSEGKEYTYLLVGEIEANSLEGKISGSSPLGKQLLGKKIGELVSIHLPLGIREYTIKDIS